jgi:RHS repeat-associated protein
MRHNYTYVAFGTLENMADRTNNNYLFAGEQWDQNLEEYYLRQRYYDSWIGRFASGDWFEGSLYTPESLHNYLYASNKPVSYVDPSGNFSILNVASVVVISYILYESVVPLPAHAPGISRAANGDFSDPLSPERGFVDAASIALTISSLGLLAQQRITRSIISASPEELAGSIRSVNPGYPSRGRTNNCINCSVATDSMLAGRPASALPGDITPIKVLEEIYGSRFVHMASREAIEESLKTSGSGSRAIIFGYRGMPGQPNHVFNAVNQRGTIRFLDGQTGRPADFTPYQGLYMLKTN